GAGTILTSTGTAPQWSTALSGLTGLTLAAGAGRVLNIAQAAADMAGDGLSISAGAAGTSSGAAYNGGILKLSGGSPSGAGAPGYVQIDTPAAGAPDNAASFSPGSLYVEDMLEVDGWAMFDAKLDANGIFELGDNGETGAIDTTNWDIDTSGNATFASVNSGDIVMSGYLAMSKNPSAITAGTTQDQANATQLGSTVNVVSTVGTAGDGVKLPSVGGNAGMVVYVINNGAQSMKLYPFLGAEIDALGANAAKDVAAGAAQMCLADGSGSWECFVLAH
ncbi:hypothetical protein ACFLZO_01210, partial [Patescibacteria group bacterium]